MLQPKKTKYRKSFRGRMKGKSVLASKLDFGEFGIKSLSRGYITGAQIEAARRAVTHYTKRKAKLWIRVFPNKPITKKGPGAPMGAGKGDIDHWAMVVKPGRVLLEISGVPEEIAKISLARAAHKLPFKTRILSREI